MLTLLQLSDIHFRIKPDELDEYSQMRVRMIETIEDYCKKESIDAILICGDIAFSGRQVEYEEKAKLFISDLLAKTGCENEQVFMVPGNHDKNRDAKDGNTRALMRDGLLYGRNGDQLLSQICQDEVESLYKLVLPFEDYIKYANIYRCASIGDQKAFLGEKLKSNDKLYWNEEIGNMGGYKIVLYGLNSCLVSDWEDMDDPKNPKEKEHQQYMSKQMYNITKHREEINISMMHHPLNFIKDGDDIENSMDKKFSVQFYGHIHKQSAQNGDALKVFSGALQPSAGEVEKDKAYNPIFNIIQMDVKNDTLHVVIFPYKWEWTDKEDGVFNTDKPMSYQINVKDNLSGKQPKRDLLTLPVNETARGIEIKLMTKPHGESIIKKMYPDFELRHNQIADFEEFFCRLRKDDRYTELYEHLK